MVRSKANTMTAPINPDNTARNELLQLWWKKVWMWSAVIERHKRERKERDDGDT